VQAAVAEGRADVGIFVPPLLDNRLATHGYRQGELAVIVPLRHALARRKAVRFEQLLEHDIVGLHHGAAAQELMRAEAEGAGRTLRARLQVRGFEAIAQLVEAGLGVAVMPSATAARLARLFGVRLIALDEPWAQREYRLAVRRQELLPTVVQRFVNAVCRTAHNPDPAAGGSPP
jgi:DNA-binding transcriptional LysR family regulator